MSITIKPVRSYIEEPIFIAVENLPEEVTCAFDENGNYFPAQKMNDGIVVILTTNDKEISLTFSDEKSFDSLSFKENHEKLDVFYDNVIFTSYQYPSELKKPFLGPVYSEKGDSFTRTDLHHKEHPHQRSIFVGIGDVNGVDLWNEPENSGFLIKGKPKNIVTGSSYASFDADNIWCDKDGNKLIDENRKFTFYNQKSDCRYVDIEITFKASYCDIVFGDTKEAGPLGIRVNEKIDVAHGGYMINSYGARGESECWSKSAQWCLYGGKIDGNDCAIAVFDNESNERYPTCWHIRDYGLFAANNLYFRGGLNLKKNQALKYKYRICFFNNSAKDVCDRFLIYNMNK